MKVFLALALLAIVASLALALTHMMRGQRTGSGPDRRMARALAVRIGLSVALFLCLLLAWRLGFIQPTGLPAGR